MHKEELENNFHWWITCIPDRLEFLETILPENIMNQLDYTPTSLKPLGEYLVNSETVDSIEQKNEMWDSLASYVGVVYEKSVSGAKWRVELDDEDNVYYGVPALRTPSQLNFCPKYEITTLIGRNRPDYLYAIVSRHINFAL